MPVVVVTQVAGVDRLAALQMARAQHREWIEVIQHLQAVVVTVEREPLKAVNP
jgi:hypothetical protein